MIKLTVEVVGKGGKDLLLEGMADTLPKG